MNAKKLLLVGGAVLAAAAIIVTVIVTRPADPAPEGSPPPAELGLDSGASSGGGEASPGDGDFVIPEGSGYLTGPNGETEATTVEIADVPAEILGQGQRLAEVWVTFDSSSPNRESQLAAVIPNAADWATHRPSVHTTSKSVGDPTWKTISVVQSARADNEMSMTEDAQYRVVTEVAFQAQHWTSGITYAGSETTTAVWVFILGADGALIDVIEPSIA